MSFGAQSPLATSRLASFFEGYKYAELPQTGEKVGPSAAAAEGAERTVTDLTNQGNQGLVHDFKQKMVKAFGLPENFLTLILGDLRAQRLDKGEEVEADLIKELLSEMDRWISLKDRIVVGLNPGKDAFKYMSQEFWTETLQVAFNGDVVNRAQGVKKDSDSSVLKHLETMGYLPGIFSENLKARLISSETRKTHWAEIEQELKACVHLALMVYCVRSHNMDGFADVAVARHIPSHTTGSMFGWGGTPRDTVKMEVGNLKSALRKAGINLGLFTQDIQDAVENSHSKGVKLTSDQQIEIEKQVREFQKRSEHLAMLMKGQAPLPLIDLSMFAFKSKAGLDVEKLRKHLQSQGYEDLLSYDDCTQGRVTFYTPQGDYTTKLSAFASSLEGIERMQQAFDAYHLLSVYLHGTLQSIHGSSASASLVPPTPPAPAPAPIAVPAPLEQQQARSAPATSATGSSKPRLVLAANNLGNLVPPQTLLHELEALKGEEGRTTFAFRSTGARFDLNTGEIIRPTTSDRTVVASPASSSRPAQPRDQTDVVVDQLRDQLDKMRVHITGTDDDDQNQ